MAAWQRKSDSRWFDPATKDFTATDPIEMDQAALNTMGVDARGVLSILWDKLGTDLQHTLRVATKETNYA